MKSKVLRETEAAKQIGPEMDGMTATRPAGRPDGETGGSLAMLLAWWRRLAPKDGFTAHVLTLMSGTVPAQIALVVSAPVLTRLYDPMDFTVYALFAVGANLGSAIAAGRYEFALMLPEKDEDAGNVAVLAFTLSATVALVALAMVAAFCCWPTRGGDLPGDGLWIWLVPAGVLIYAWFAVAARWQSRKQRFRSMAYAEIGAAIGSLSVQISAGLMLISPSGIPLICGHLLGRSVALLILSRGMCADLFHFRGKLSQNKVKAAAKRYWQFPAFSCVGSLLGKGTREVPKLMLAALFAPQILGFYSLSGRVLGMPMALVGRSFGSVFFPKISACRHDKGRSRTLLLKSCRNLFLLVLVPMLVLLFWAEPIFGFVFGEQWVPAGHYTRLLIPILTAQFVVAPIGLSMQAFEKQRVVTLWQASFLCVSASAFLFGHIMRSAEIAILTYSLLSAIMYLIYLAMIFHCTQGCEMAVSTADMDVALADSTNAFPQDPVCRDKRGLTGEDVIGRTSRFRAIKQRDFPKVS